MVPLGVIFVNLGCYIGGFVAPVGPHVRICGARCALHSVFDGFCCPGRHPRAVPAAEGERALA